jgi:hypothetical protein
MRHGSPVSDTMAKELRRIASVTAQLVSTLSSSDRWDQLMRMPPVRFTVRRTMVAVALIGLLCYAVMLWDRYLARGRRATLHSSLSIYHRGLATHLLDSAAVNKRTADQYRSIRGRITSDNQSQESNVLPRMVEGLSREADLMSARDRIEGEGHSRLAQYHDALKRKYGWAARRPWILVTPDPPTANGPASPPALITSIESLQQRQARSSWMAFAVTGLAVVQFFYLAVRIWRQSWRTSSIYPTGPVPADPIPPRFVSDDP